MTLSERFAKEFEELPDEKKEEVMGFIESLKNREENNLPDTMYNFVDDIF